MNKAFATVLVIVAFVTVLAEQSDAIFRASKDQTKKLQREVPVRNAQKGGPVCSNAGNGRLRSLTADSLRTGDFSAAWLAQLVSTKLNVQIQSSSRRTTNYCPLLYSGSLVIRRFTY